MIRSAIFDMIRPSNKWRRSMPVIVALMACSLLPSCFNIDRDRPLDKTDLTGSDYRLFQGTPAWELAKAVQDGDEKQRGAILAKDPALINYQAPKNGGTLIM